MVREQQPLLRFLSPILVPPPRGGLVLVPQKEEFDGDTEHMAEGMVEDP